MKFGDGQAEKIAGMTIDAWAGLPDRPTLEVDCACGTVYFVCDQGEYGRLSAQGKACFSPQEIRELVMASRVGAIPEGMVEKVVMTKREFPGAILSRILQGGVPVASGGPGGDGLAGTGKQDPPKGDAGQTTLF